jgi:hypothetical protein
LTRYCWATTSHITVLIGLCLKTECILVYVLGTTNSTILTLWKILITLTG